MKYRQKPMTVEAFKWTGGHDQEEDPLWIVEAIKKGDVLFENVDTPDVRLKIKSFDGIQPASVGDYIIKGKSGKLYPCGADLFEATFDKAE